MASEDLREYLEAARQRRVHEQDARKQEMAARHEARRRDFEARSEPLNVHVVRVLEGARADLAEAGAKLEYKFHSYNAGKQLENPRVEFQIAGVGSPGTASSVYVIEIVQDGQVVVRTKRSFGDPNSTLTPHGSTPRTAVSRRPRAGRAAMETARPEQAARRPWAPERQDRGRVTLRYLALEPAVPVL